MCCVFSAGGGAVGYQCADFCLLLSSRGVTVPLPTWFPTCIHYIRFCHLIEWSSFGYASVYLVFQCLSKVNWTPCDRDEHWYCYTFELRYIHDLPTEVVKMRQQDNIGNSATRTAFSWGQDSWVVPAEPLLALNEAKAQKQFEGDECEVDVEPSYKVMKDILAVEVDVEDDRDLWDTLFSGWIAVALVCAGISRLYKNQAFVCFGRDR